MGGLGNEGRNETKRSETKQNGRDGKEVVLEKCPFESPPPPDRRRKELGRKDRKEGKGREGR